MHNRRELIILAASCLSAATAWPARSAAADLAPLVCSADDPVVEQGKATTLRAWVAEPGETQFDWRAERGRLGSAGRALGGSEISWTSEGVKGQGTVIRATVSARGGTGQIAVCSVQVIVKEAERGGRESRSWLLRKNMKEAPGFGLYSYLLLIPDPLPGPQRERYLAIIKAYYCNLGPIEDQEHFKTPSEINVTYLPVKEFPRPSMSRNCRAAADWLLDNYDFIRAKDLLHALPGDIQNGLYIVSSLTPLSEGQGSSAHIMQNLSTVPLQPPELISWWVNVFMDQAAQERYWDSKRCERLVLEMRTFLSRAAEDLPEVKGAVKDWLAWR